MKVLIDCHTFDIGFHGTTTFLAGIINNSHNSKFFEDNDVELILVASSKKNIDKFVNVQYRFKKINTNFFIRNLFSIPFISFYEKSDITISQYVRPLYVYNRSISVVHDVLFLDFKDSFSFLYRLSRSILYRISSRFSSKIVTVSDYSKNRIVKHFGISPNKVNVVKNGIKKIDHQRKACKNNKMIKLIYVSRLEERKRQDWCINLVDDLLSEGIDCNLTLIGDGKCQYSSNIKKMISERTDERVKLQTLSDEELYLLYQNSDIFLFPSLCEGFGIPVIEASYFGLPCVVSDKSALEELNGQYVGKSFNNNSYKDFLVSVISVINNYEVFSQKALLNREHIYKEYNWKDISNNFFDAIN